MAAALSRLILPSLVSSNKGLVSASCTSASNIFATSHQKHTCKPTRRPTGYCWFSPSPSEAIEDDSDEEPHLTATKFITPFREKKWNKWVDRLHEYKRRQGHCNICTETCDDINLLTWVETQRHQYRLHEEGKPSRLTPDRIRRLEEVGFVWSLHKLRWDEHFDRYCEYVRENGTDATLPENDTLRTWAQKQRKLFKKGGKLELVGTALSPVALKKRREKLESIGFVLEVRESKWMEKYEMLQEYFRNNGNCLVPHNIPVLGKWVDDQRRQYRKRQSGGKSTLTDERLQLLEAIGFVWNALDAKWEEKYQDLQQFVAHHGNCCVPVNYKPNPSLSIWVRNQYKLHRKHEDGQKTSLTQERIAKLVAVGFLDNWNRRN